MSTAPTFTDDLLDPISADQPTGADMRWTPEWDRIKEAGRADDDLDSGKWAKRDRKAADWRLVEDLAAAMLRNRTKDLQLALWLTEAGIKLNGFAGLRDGLRITRELMVRYWGQGLYPAMEDGPEDRAGPFEWLNNKLVDSITAIPITVRVDDGQDYSFIDLEDARRIGSDANCRTADGDIDAQKKKAYDQALADGHISMEMLDLAIKATRRPGYEKFNAVFQQAYDEFKLLEKLNDEKFGDAAPNMAACRTALSDIRQAVADILEQKRHAEPDAPPVLPETDSVSPARPASTSTDSPGVIRFPSYPGMQGSQPAPGISWHEAEMLIRSGQVDRGLAEMTRLAASETSGRSRFQRKLLLAEVCLGSRRERLGRLILEELAEHIDKFQLESWESSELISSVWTRLYKLYKQGADSSDLDRAGKLYERLCRLDPWQALECNE